MRVVAVLRSDHCRISRDQVGKVHLEHLPCSYFFAISVSFLEYITIGKLQGYPETFLLIFSRTAKNKYFFYTSAEIVTLYVPCVNHYTITYLEKCYIPRLLYMDGLKSHFQDKLRVLGNEQEIMVPWKGLNSLCRNCRQRELRAHNLSHVAGIISLRPPKQLLARMSATYSYVSGFIAAKLTIS